MRIALIIFLIIFVLAGVKLVGFLQKKNIYINRWIFGFSAFLVVLIPTILFQNLPTAVNYGLYLLSGMCQSISKKENEISLLNFRLSIVKEGEQKC